MQDLAEGRASGRTVLEVVRRPHSTQGRDREILGRRKMARAAQGPVVAQRRGRPSADPGRGPQEPRGFCRTVQWTRMCGTMERAVSWTTGEHFVAFLLLVGDHQARAQLRGLFRSSSNGSHKSHSSHPSEAESEDEIAQSGRESLGDHVRRSTRGFCGFWCGIRGGDQVVHVSR